MPHYSSSDLSAFDQTHRRNLLNLVSGIKSAHLIGSYNANGVSNLGVFNSVVHIGANPFLLGFIQRPLTVERQTYSNIKNHGTYSLNAISKTMIENAHQCSAKYDDGVSEFKATGLTEKKITGFNAPFVEESPIQLGLRFVEELPIKSNGCVLVIGQVEHLWVDDSLTKLNDEGFVDLAKLGLVGIGGLDSYYETSLLARLPYARV
jgi:flavin reductase (DIM6/NTAB) family NADH-FMN oxidoreductase RutF